MALALLLIFGSVGVQAMCQRNLRSAIGQRIKSNFNVSCWGCFMVPFPGEAECLAYVKLDISPAQMPPNLGPREMIGPALAWLNLGLLRPPPANEVRLCPIIKQHIRSELREISNYYQTISGCRDVL